MAMRETKSSTNSTSDSWSQFHTPPNISSPTPTPTMFTISDATMTTTTTTTPTDAAAATTDTSSHQLSPEGRVSKPIRRRSRASRRTPTTLLNTDPTNFRAMVQQFTGGSIGGSGSGFTAPFIRAASSLQFDQQILQNPNNAVVVPTGAYYHQLQLQQQQRQQQQQQQQQREHDLHQYQQRPFVFSDIMNNIGSQGGGFVMDTEGNAISTHAPPSSGQNRSSNGSNNSMF